VASIKTAEFNVIENGNQWDLLLLRHYTVNPPPKTGCKPDLTLLIFQMRNCRLTNGMDRLRLIVSPTKNESPVMAQQNSAQSQVTTLCQASWDQQWHGLHKWTISLSVINSNLRYSSLSLINSSNHQSLLCFFFQFLPYFRILIYNK